jgi:hypothetical protein
MALRAGHIATTADFASTLGSTETAIGTTVATAFTATLTGAGALACGIAFTAPPSGSVIVHNSSVVDSSDAAQRSYCTFRIRTGSTIGSGTDFVAAADVNSIYNLGTSDICVGRAILVTGLTPGSSYNCQQLFRSASGAATATFLNKHLIVQPVN